MKRAAIYDPYIDTIGGGERYMMTVASVLKKNGWDVEIAWNNPKVIGRLKERLGIGLEGIEVVKNISRGAGYDLVFWLSDGSIPTLFGKKNILHFQTPFHGVGGRSVVNRIKFLKINEIVCNSKFTKSFIDKEYGVRSKVVYPPVAVRELRPGKKENIIVSVGRFSKLQQSKGQNVLVNSFKSLCREGLKNWRLILAGGSEVGGGDFVRELKKSAEGHPVSILENIPFSEVKKIYGKAKIFWSASGFGADEKEEPEKVEHFGISTVEGMAAGCVPVVYRAGGHKEIVVSGEDGFLWQTEEELAKITLKLTTEEGKRKNVAKKSEATAEKFSVSEFEKNILEVIK